MKKPIVRRSIVKRATRNKVKINKSKVVFILIIMAVILIFNTVLYEFDKKVMPRVMTIGDAEMRAKAIFILNDNISKIFKDNFNYGDIIKVDKNEAGDITMIRADTLKMNTLATEVALNSQKDLREIGAVGIKIPLGYVLNNNIIANLGPDIGIKMKPVGDIQVTYSSEFESAGINQTRHRIYLHLSTRLKVNVPLKSTDLEVKHEIPICETIIIGKIPNTNLQMDGGTTESLIKTKP
ncbi:sporulation protein YunB [Clostridium frigidicarnis]|uniref:Sporulation protein YunB n=1 Tax=Clostridium frigidicarnis TaxID=84698 RepID=A0A1I0VJI9_9CLOT|nr:sporulation protein YunB [Clostridium frigidicarnis]SFA76482.1 sporulation protein YunB [Clostridium frigidicarnis]